MHFDEVFPDRLIQRGCFHLWVRLLFFPLVGAFGLIDIRDNFFYELRGRHLSGEDFV